MKTRSFKGKVAAITGAASGMGRALAMALAKRGCHVALCDVNEAGLAETASSISGVTVSTRRVDVSDEEAVRAWARGVAQEHGGVNLIFNNAGVSYGGSVRGADLAECRRVMDIDYWGVVHGTRAFLPHLEASGDGHVVNTSSLFGLIGFPGQSAYNSAKFAVRGFTEALQIELAMMGVPVSATCVHPGGVKTNISRASKVHPSLAELGVSLERVQEDFEQGLRLTPAEAAEDILWGVSRNQRRVLVGRDARMLDVLQRMFPAQYQELVMRLVMRVNARRLHG